MKKKIYKLLIVLSSAILLIVLTFFTDSFDELGHIFRNAKIYWLAAGLGCMVMYWILDAAVLHRITVTMEKGHRWKDSVRVTMIGQFFHTITPFAGGGEPIQAYVMVKDGVKPGVAASIFVVKSFIHQTIIVVYGIVAYIFYGGIFASRIPEFNYFFISGLALNTAFMVFVILLLYKGHLAKRILMFFTRLISKIKFIKNASKLERRVESEIESFRGGALIIKKDRRLLVGLTVLQALQFTFLFLITYFIHLAVESFRVSPVEVIASQSMVVLLSLIVPTPGGTGGVEGLSYMFYGMFFTKGFIIPVILIYRLLSYYPSVIVGGLFALFAPEKPLEHASGNVAGPVSEERESSRLGSGSRYRLQYVRKQRFIKVRRCQGDRT
ncbi:MAG: flippase-like domain-containing protein [Clostridiaceae bacterium]|jgi:uncharacterized protein (TIRG00374 family)|nr:flippase-like domain-containing protein [Clostridiaceae bacterium]